MAYTKQPWHSGPDYTRRSAAVRAYAYAHPDVTCWRCGHTLEQIRKRKPRAKWTAGHLVDGEIGGTLAAECSPCNYSAGARRGNAGRGKTALSW